MKKIELIKKIILLEKKILNIPINEQYFKVRVREYNKYKKEFLEKRVSHLEARGEK